MYNNTILATYADDTAILAMDESQVAATSKLQKAINKMTNWMNDWKIKLNQQKFVHDTFILHKVDHNNRVYINEQAILQKNSAKYLGKHLDARLTWKHHVKKKLNKSVLKPVKCTSY